MNQAVRQLRASLLVLFCAVALVLGAMGAVQAFAAPAQSQALVDTSTTAWRYYDKGDDPAAGKDRTAWTAKSFDTASWKEGSGSFGAKRGRIAGLGTDASGVNCTPTVLLNQYLRPSVDVPAYFFRTDFSLDSLEGFKSLKAKVAYDDAIIVYVNGTKVFSGNVPARGYASNDSYGAESAESAPNVKEFLIDKKNLVAGTNTLAVEVHQANETSSDIYFDFRSLAKSNDVPQAPAKPKPVKNEAVLLGDVPTTLHFVWDATSTKAGQVQIAPADQVTGDDMPSSATVKAADESGASSIEGYQYEKATVKGLEQGKTYKYRVGNDEGWSPIYSVTVGATGDFSFFWMGDPQIGAGSREPDTEGWKKTLDACFGAFPRTNFTFSAGDQVNRGSDEREYEGFLAPEQLKTAPLAVLVGNHDNRAANYSEHWRAFGGVNDPDTRTTAGSESGDTSFVYNNTLFMVLNSNDRSTAKHKAFMEKAIAAHPDVDWKVVTFHHAIFSTASHSDDGDIIQRRKELAPLFTKLNIDLVLMGHDHVYTRTYMMDGLTPDTSTGASVIPDKDDGKVLYVTANSASGSKFYTIKDLEFPYSFVKNQERVPNYTKVDVSKGAIKVETYRSSDNSLVDSVTLEKAAKPAPAPKLDVNLTVGGKKVENVAFAATVGKPFEKRATISMVAAERPELSIVSQTEGMGLTAKIEPKANASRSIEVEKDLVVSGVPTKEGDFKATLKVTAGNESKDIDVTVKVGKATSPDKPGTGGGDKPGTGGDKPGTGGDKPAPSGGDKPAPSGGDKPAPSGGSSSSSSVYVPSSSSSFVSNYVSTPQASRGLLPKTSETTPVAPFAIMALGGAAILSAALIKTRKRSER